MVGAGGLATGRAQMMTEEEIRRTLREWVLGAASKKFKKDPAQAAAFNDQSPLIEGKIISSLRVMALVALVGKLRDRPVDMEELQVGAFESIDLIYRNFFQDSARVG
jgi:hypothetical protein